MRLQVADENEVFTKADELIEWLDENDILMNLTDKEAGVLISYMEAHGYGIGVRENRLVRIDITETENIVEDYSIDDVIDSVFDWNYELITEADKERKNPDNFIDFCKKQERYESLLEDERIIEKMFDRTVYGKAMASAFKKVSLTK